MIKNEAMPGEFKEGQTVELSIKTVTDLGYKAIINGTHWGVLYYNEVFVDLEKNQVLSGFIKTIRPDGRIDLTLYKDGNKDSKAIGDLILKALKNANGYLAVGNKTEAEEIYTLFGVSKKKFKIALGGLYKQRFIEIKEDGIVPGINFPTSEIE